MEGCLFKEHGISDLRGFKGMCNTVLLDENLEKCYSKHGERKYTTLCSTSTARTPGAQSRGFLYYSVLTVAYSSPSSHLHM